MLGRALSASQGEAIQARVIRNMKYLARANPEEWQGKTYSDQLHEAAAAAATEMKEEFARKRMIVERTIARHAAIEDFIGSQPHKKAGDTIKAVSKLLDFDTSGGGYTSVQSWGNSIRDFAFAEMRKTFEAIPGNFYGLFEDKAGVADLWKELHGEDSGNATAKAGAAAFHKGAEEMRNRFNDAGGSVGKLEDWGVPQHHSQERVAGASLEQWMADTLPKLDRSKYVNANGSRMNDGQMHDFLMHAYDSIITEGKNSQEPGNVAGSGLVSNRNSASRQIFFKDADAHAAYNSLYGERSLSSLLTGHVSRMARDIALAERLSPNAAASFKMFNDRALLDEMRMDPTKADMLKKEHAFNGLLYDAVAGQERVYSQKVADRFQHFRNWMTATRLGKVVITALGDEAGMMSTAFANKVPYTQTMIEQMRTHTSKGDREFAEGAGLGQSAAVGNLNRWMQEEMNPSFSQKMASTTMRITGAEAMWRGRRQGMGITIMSAIGKLAKQFESIKDLSVGDQGVLAKKGVTEAQWQVWRRAVPEQRRRGEDVLTPGSIYAIPDEKLKDLGDPTALKREAATQLLAHTMEESGMGAMDTGPRQRVTVSPNLMKGSYMGEIWRSMNLFRGFAYSMMMKHWARAMDQPTPMSKLKYTAPLFLYGTLIAGVGNQIRNFIAGKDPEPMLGKGATAFWTKALLRGGGLGVFGDLVQSETTSHGSSLTGLLGGPLFSTLEEVDQLTRGAIMAKKRGEILDERAKLIRFGKENLPILNTWYTQAAADHFLWNHLQEMSSPGYSARMEAKQRAKFGTTYFWKPTDTLPHAAPDVAKAVGGLGNQAQFAGEQ